MRPLARPPILFLCTTSSSCSKWNGCHFFYSTSSSSPSPSPRRHHHHHDEESRNVKVSVWWDFENCNVPSGVNVSTVAQRITTALRANGIKGPVSITAFGDFLQISKSNQEALSMTGVGLNHVPRGGKNSADRSLLVDLMCWVSQNPPPAHLFLISGDKDFANILHRLRMNNYNILLASTEPAPGVLCSAASIMWHWNHLIRGDNISGKHFSIPPDGPYGSWYGYYKGPLEDPFSDIGQPACSQAEESPAPTTDSKSRSIPKALVNHIRQIVNLYPKGISITELREELGRSNFTIDKEFFGYKKFSLFLKSLSTILSLQSIGDGQFIAHAVLPNAETVDFNLSLSSGLERNRGNDGRHVTTELNGRNNDLTAVSEKSPSPLNSLTKEEPPSLDPSNGATSLSEKLSSPAHSVQKEKPPPVGPQKTDAPPTEDHSTLVEQHGPSIDDHSTLREQQHDCYSEEGFFQRMWRTWFASESGTFSEESNHSASVGSIDETKYTENSLDSSGQGLRSSVSSSFLTNVNASVVEGKTKMISEENDQKSNPLMAFVNQIVNWWSPREIATDTTSKSPQCGNEVNQINSQIEDHELLSKETFWDDMGTFLLTPKGSAIISQSKTREQMAQELAKEGPLLLYILSAGDLLRLVDLLISEKKWVKESLSQEFPFKLKLPVRRWCSQSKPHGSKGLSSIFSATSSQSNIQRSPDHKRGNENGKNDETVAFSSQSNKRTSEKSRSDILADCHKLAAEILKKHPEGFNIGSFRDLFLQKYGYALMYRKLGYQILAALLQEIPGVKIEDNFLLAAGRTPENIIPYVIGSNKGGKVCNPCYEVSDSTRKDDDQDNLWKELGPIFNRASGRNGSKLNLDLTTDEKLECVNVDDASNFSDVSSDSDEESSFKEKLEKRKADRNNDEGSSLLEVLDMWYAKDDKGMDCSKNELKCPSPVSTSGRKTKPQKHYSFVSNKVEDEKEELIDSILGGLKNSTESRMQKT